MRRIRPDNLGEPESLQILHQGHRSLLHPPIFQYLKMNLHKKRSNMLQHLMHPANDLNFVSLDVNFNHVWLGQRYKVISAGDSDCLNMCAGG